MRKGAALAAGSLALALLGSASAAKGQAGSSAEPGASSSGEGWREFEGSWVLSGRRTTVPAESGAVAAVVEASGAVVLARTDGFSRGFRGEAVAFDDGQGVSLGRAVWTDEHGDRVFSRLTGEPLEKGKRVVGTITGGTGRYAGLEGEYSFTWQYVLSGEAGTLQGRAVGLQGRVRQKGEAP